MRKQKQRLELEFYHSNIYSFPFIRLICEKKNALQRLLLISCSRRHHTVTGAVCATATKTKTKANNNTENQFTNIMKML